MPTEPDHLPLDAPEFERENARRNRQHDRRRRASIALAVCLVLLLAGLTLAFDLVLGR